MAAKMNDELLQMARLFRDQKRDDQKSLGRFESTSQVDGHCVTLSAPDSYEAGQYLRLRYAIEANSPMEQGMVVGICSPAAGDGKSLTAMNLAGALAQCEGSRVLLVDADLRRRSEVIRKLVPIPGGLTPGLSELLSNEGEHDVEDVARRVEGTNIWAVLTGSFPIAPYEAFSSERFGLFMDRARSSFDYVVIDAPPVIAVPDCKLLAEWVDGLVMVVSANQTPRLLLAQALENLGPEKILGLLFNKTDQVPPRYYRYYGTYGYAARAKVDDISRIAGVEGDFQDASDEEAGDDGQTAEGEGVQDASDEEAGDDGETAGIEGDFQDTSEKEASGNFAARF